MNRFCERCERTTLDGNLWCPEPDCPAEAGYALFGYGDFLGDLKITKLVRAWRTAALYEAQRGETQVLVKVAHRGEETEERLRREAHAFESLTPKPSALGAFFASFRPSPRPILLRPLPPYPTPAKRPFGEISFRGETKVFSVFQYVKGKLLSDVLLENPQIWHSEAAWLIATVAEALRPLTANKKCHLSLTPDVILVDVDADGHVRPTLLDLGFLLEGNEMGSLADWARLCEPAYTAPELLNGQRVKTVNPSADVYSLGLIFYELLAGRPGFEPKLRRDEQVRELVAKGAGSLPVERPELEQAGVIKIVDRAIARNNRFNTVTELGEALTAIYSTPPKEKRPTPRRFYVLIILLMLVLLMVAGIVGYVLFQVWLATR